MELHKTPERTKSGFVLLDQNMRLVKPVNEYLDFQALRGRAENTLLAYGKDLKTFFEFLEQRKLQYDQVTANMIRDYVEYLRAPDVNTVYLFVESKRSPATINRMISTLHGFYQHEDADFMVGENVMLIVQRYEDEKLQMYGKIMSKW